MKDKLRLVTAFVKLSFPVFVLITTINTFSVSWLSLTSAWFNTQVKAVSNKVESGYWTPAVPTPEGWNLEQDSPNPDDIPTDLSCGQVTNGGDPEHPRASFVWSAVSGSNIVYQREITHPDESTTFSYHQQNYTDFASFGSDQGIDGLWANRVRAFEDVNDNGVYDADTDVASAWSSPCEITLDTTGPELAFNNLPRDTEINVDDTDNLDVEGSIEDRGSVAYEIFLHLDDGNEDGQFDPADTATGHGSGPETMANADGGNFILHELNFDDLAGGTYWVVFTAQDDLDNQSQLVQKIELTRASGETTVTVTNSPTRAVKNVLTNNSFEYGLDGWDTSDQVELKLVTEDQPHHGQQFVSLGSGQTLSQTIDNQGRGVRSVGFWYQLPELDTEKIKQPALTVYANDQLMAQYQQPTHGSWQFASIYLAEEDAPEIEIRLETSDQVEQVLVDNFSNERIVVNSDAVFSLETEHPESIDQVFYQYSLGGNLVTKQGPPGMDFKLPAQPDQGLVEYWSVDKQGQAETKDQIYVIVDNQAPQTINDVRAYNENDGEYSLSFTAPADDLFEAVREYEVRYAQDPITSQTDISELPLAQFVSGSQLDDSSPVPTTAGLTQTLMVGGLEPAQDYYFVVQAIDQAGNTSIMSNVAQTKHRSNQEQFSSSPVMINEIMYHFEAQPSTDGQIDDFSQTQWVELYNQGSEPIDLSHWSIQNQDGQVLTIDAQRADTNQDLTDQGETIIPAQGHLVVVLGQNNFLSKWGQVSLVNSADEVVNSYHYQGSAELEESEARLKDGQEHWLLSSRPTPAQSNQNPDFKPSIRLFAVPDRQLQLEINDAENYQNAKYVLTYQHQPDDKKMTAGLEDQLELDSDQVKSDPLPLQTCSGGDCVSHDNIDIDSVKVTVTLYPEVNEEQSVDQPLVLETRLEGDWPDVD
jgi:hypothetical protein